MLIRKSVRLALFAGALFLGVPSGVEAQAATIPCGPGDAPFLSAASEIEYGCGYLVESKPPQYSLAESYFRRAVEMEPGNAIATVLLAVTQAAQGRSEQARATFADAQRLDPAIMDKLSVVYQQLPSLREMVNGALAANTPPPANAEPRNPRNAPPPPPAAAPPAAGAAVFPVGSRVEIEYRAGEWFAGVVTSVDPGVCPYYRVEADTYGNGNPSNLGYFCKSVRAPTGIGPTVAACGGSNPNCPPKAPPPLGRYTCDVTRWDVTEGRNRLDYQGYFELLAGGRYRWLDDGGTGTYAYNPTTHLVTWRSGPMQAHGGTSEFGLDGTTPEITVTMHTDYTRRTGNEPVRWQCGLSR